MTSNHPYRAALPKQAAWDELCRYRDTQFDGVVVDALIRVLELAGDLPPCHAKDPAPA
jgi:HD-GYP domain-containing protein (c-di-GMP phosphodiesterase class II)